MADNVAEVTARAYAIAHAIPVGRVTTYGESRCQSTCPS